MSCRRRPAGAYIFVRKVFCGVAFALALGAFHTGCEHTSEKGSLGSQPWPAAVGRAGTNLYLTPTGQLLTPAGEQLELPGMRPQVLALSPDGKVLATAGKANELVLISVATQKIVSKQALTARVGKTNAAAVEISLTGLVFAPDGKRLYLSTADGNVRAFPIEGTNKPGPPVLFKLPEAVGADSKTEIPIGLAISPDGQRLYVVANLSNKLHELDTRTGDVLRSWNVGVAPYDVALAGEKMYVSNLGGRRPTAGDTTAPAARKTSIRVDSVRYIASEGSVSVIDLKRSVVTREILVELHASALAVSPDKHYVVVANTGSDTLSVIDTRTDQVIERIWARQSPGDLFGAQPNALTFDSTGKYLFACNGTQNAVAVIRFAPRGKNSEVLGLIPVGWFPGAVLWHPTQKTLCVANIKGVGALKTFKAGAEIKLGSKDFFGTISFIKFPSHQELAAMTTLALRNMRYPALLEAKLPARPGRPARPIPERVGEPSVFKHVIYVIKENRTYDQILGDMPEGNGATNLCTFGEKYTPNLHKICREFVLLDNTYCSSVQSSDGHQWTDSALANEYVERQVTSGAPRSYTGGKGEGAVDALGWSSSGFIWDNAIAHGRTFRNYGEWLISEAGWKGTNGSKKEPLWIDFYKDHTTGTNRTVLKSRPGIESLRNYSKLDGVGWDLRVPDIMRAASFIKELKQFESNGFFPQFILLFLPNDHTGGAKETYPTPGAQIADNDLAFGQIVEALTQSKFWPETCLFSIEDDSQAGWDHVSGYRTTCYVVSPYTKRGQTISTRYNHLSVVRSMELILGLPPMNQMDATAIPMTDCFMDIPDLTPFTSVTNTFPLDEINPPAKKIPNPVLKKDAHVSARLNLDEVDKCPEDLFNRILWRAMKGTEEPYPEWAIKLEKDLDDD
jgi:YVTN family beta-propeller protein